MELLTDQEAAVLKRDWNTLDAAQQQQASGLLGAWQHDKQTKLWGAVLEPEKLPDTNGTFAALEKERPGLGVQARKEKAVIMWLAQEGNTDERSVTYDLTRHAAAYSAKLQSAPLEPLALYEKIRPLAEQQKDEALELNGAAQEGYLAALSGDAEPQALSRWQGSVAGRPTYKTKGGELSAQWQKSYLLTKAAVEEAGVAEFLESVKNDAAKGWQESETGQGKVADFADRLIHLEPEKRRVALLALLERAKSGEAGFGESMKEGLVRFVAGWTLQQERNIEDVVLSEAPAATAKITNAAEAEAYVKAEAARPGARAIVGNGAKQRQLGAYVEMRPLEDEEKQLVEAAKAKALERIDLGRELKAIADGTLKLDPMGATLGTSLTLAAATIATGGGALGYSAIAYAENNYNEIRLSHPDIDRGTARAISAVSGAAEAALDKLDIEIFKTLPNVGALLKNGLTRTALVQGAKQFGSAFVKENAQEGLQDMVLPLVTQAFAADGIDLDKELHGWATSRGEVAISMLPLLVIGVGAATVADVRGGMLMLQENNRMGMAGIAEADRIKIMEAARSGDDKAATAAVVAAWPNRDAALAAEFRAVNDAAKVTAQQAHDAASYGVAIRYNGKTWTVTLGDGQTVQASSAEAAERIRSDLMLAATEQEADSMVSQVEAWASERSDIRREVNLTGDLVEAKGDKMQATTARGQVREISNPEALASVRAQTVGMGSQDIDVAINGSNEVFAENVAGSAADLVQLITLNRSTAQTATTTFLHERVEANLKGARFFGIVSAQEVQTALAVAARALPVEPTRARLEALQKRGAHRDHIAEAQSELELRERLHKVASGKGNETEMREVAVELAVAEVYGRDKRGGKTGLPPGSLNKLLGEAAMQATTTAEVQALGKFRSFLRSVRAWLRGVLGTVAGIEKARREGKLKDGDEFGQLVDTMMGLEGSKFAKAVEMEAREMAQTETHSATPLKPRSLVVKTWNKRIDEWIESGSAGDALIRIGSTPPALQLAGAAELTMVVPPSLLDKATTVHNVPIEALRALPDSLADPIAVFQSRTHAESLVVLTEFLEDNKPVIIAVSLDAKEGRELEVNKVASLYGKSSKTIADMFGEQLLYEDTEKSSAWARREGLQLPKRGTPTQNSGGNIPGPADVVKLSHSLSPARRLELVENRLAVVLSQDSEQARDFAQRASRRLDQLKSRYAGVPAAKSKTELDKVQRGMVESRRKDLEDMFVGDIEHRMGGVHALVTKLREHPLGDALLRTDYRRKRLYAGNLMSPAKWRAEKLAEMAEGRLETLPGDYDGADGLSPVFFKGSGRPDQVAQHLYDDGIIKGPTPDDLWQAMGEMQTELANNKELMASYTEQLKEARQKAKEEAEFEGRAWRAEEDARQAMLGNPRDAARRDVAALDAVIMAMPAEARAKLPKGLSALAAGAKSDQAFADTMTKAVLAVDKALQGYWKGKNIESLNELIELGVGKKEPGKKRRGTATPEVHRYFAEVDKVAALDVTPEQLEGKREALEKAVSASAGSAKEVDALEALQAFDMWAGFSRLSLEDQQKALDHGWQLYRTGRNVWRDKEEQRLKAQRLEAKDFVDQLGQGTYEKITIGAEDGSQGRKKQFAAQAARLGVEIRDFEGTVAALLGREHPITQRWSMMVRKGLTQKEKLLKDMRGRWQNMLDVALPGIGKRKQRSRLWEMRTKKVVTVQIEQEVSRADLTSEEKDELRATGGLGTTTNNPQLTEDQCIFLSMTYRQKQYVEPLALAGYTAEVMAKIEQAITPEGRIIREWMASEYDAGHAGLNDVMERVQGISLGKTEHYSPGRFYNWGQEKPLDVMGQGVVNAGFASGFLIERRSHFSMVNPSSALGVFWAHQNETLHWQALAEPVREMRGVLRSPDVKMALDGVWGKDFANGLLEQWMQALEGNGIRKAAGAWDKWINAATSNMAVAKLGYNVGTILKQSTAALNSALDVPFGIWIQGAGSVYSNLKSYKFIHEADFIQQRLEGTTPEVRDILGQFWNSNPGRAQGVMEKGMELLGYADAHFTTLSAAVAYESHARLAERAGMTPEQAHAIGLEKAEEVVSRTAQPTGVDRRSLFELRMGSLAKLSYMFMTEARQKGALWTEAWGNVIQGKATQRDKNLLRVAHLILAPMMQGINSMIKDWRDGPDDGEDDPAWEASDFFVAALLGPIDGIPFVGAGIKDAIAGRKYGSKGSNVIGEPITATIDVGIDLITDLFDDKEQSLGDEFDKILRFASNVGGSYGVGANIYKQGKDAVDSFQ